MQNMFETLQNNFLSAIVVRTDDPLKEGRIAVNIPILSMDGSYKPEEIVLNSNSKKVKINNAEESLSSKLDSSNYLWARPTNYVDSNENVLNITKNAGTYKIPKIGSNIMVFFLNNDPQQLYYMPFTLTVKGETISGTNILDKESWDSEKDKPNIQAIEFTNEDIIEHNDKKSYFRLAKTSGYEIIVIESSDRKEIMMKTPNNNSIKIDDLNPDNISILTSEGHSIKMSDKNGYVDIKTVGGHNAKLDDKGKKISLSSASGNTIVIDDNGGNININASGKVNVTSGDNTVINASSNAIVNASKMKVNCDLEVAGNIKCMDVKANNVKGKTIIASVSSDNKHGHKKNYGW